MSQSPHGHRQALPYPNASFPTNNGTGTPQQQLMQLQMQQQQLARLQTQQQQLMRQQQSGQQPLSQHRPQQQQHQLQRQTSTSSLSSIPSIPILPGTSIPTLSRPPELPSPSKLNSGKTSSAAKLAIPLPPRLSQDEVMRLLSQCNSTDRTLWTVQQLLGGAQINGFLRSTATAQRIKKQRARQVQWKKKDGHDEQQQEEDLKQQTMNPRTTKKIKMELTAGLMFCRQLHNVVKGLLAELEPGYVVPPLEGQKPMPPPLAQPPSIKPALPNLATPPVTKRLATVTKARVSPPLAQPTTNPGDPTGSSLRKTRKRKWSADATPKLPDSYSKLPKKEQHWRLYSILRYRSLQPGDYVAARVSSRDLWILARVVTAYPDSGLDTKEFLTLTDAKRDALFRDKVAIHDVEEKSETNCQVHRNLVLPLPRSYSEAAEWNTRLKKGSRVYAMYPKTTALYSATVIDSTTYSRDDDEIVVVEFDGDDEDASGNLPQYHIPARFVTLIPREFPASNATTKKKRAGAEPIKRKGEHTRTASNDSALNDMISEMAYGELPSNEMDLDHFDLEL